MIPETAVTWAELAMLNPKVKYDTGGCLFSLAEKAFSRGKSGRLRSNRANSKKQTPARSD